MRFRSIGQIASLLKTDYRQATLVLGSEKIVKETMALKVGDDYVVLNADTIDYYSIIDKKGLGLFAGSVARAFFGPIGHAAARAVSKTPYLRDGKQIFVFVKLKNKKRLLIQVEGGNMYLIRSKNKLPADEISQSDIKWLEGSSK